MCKGRDKVKSKCIDSSYYIDQFIRFKASADMLAWGLFPKAKEITESLSAYYAVVQSSGFDLSDPNVQVLVVGDGGTPRTGTVFACMTGWQVHSVDPEFNPKKKWDEIQRLKWYKSRIEDLKFDFGTSPVVLVHVHSHARLDASLASITGIGPRFIYAMQCCVTQKITGHEPHDVYTDRFVWSPLREVKIWSFGPQVQCA